MAKTLIRGAKAVVSCDEKDSIYHNVDILVDGPAVAAIGPGLPAGDALVIDAAGMLVYPGLVNTHHHFFQAFVRNLTTIDRPNLHLLDWLEEIYKVFVLMDEECIYYTALVCMADLLKHGCTSAFDQHYCYTPLAGCAGIDRQFEAARQTGIRFFAGRGTNTLPPALGGNMPMGMLENTETYLADCRRLIDTYHDDSLYAMRQVVMAPCQPVNCLPETFTETVRMARGAGVRMHTHLCEGENAQMLARYGKRSIAWCRDTGFLGPDVWVAHGRETLPEEYAILAESGTGISYCPAPAMMGGSETIDMKAMSAAGIVISLGCDGCATNDGSNLLDSVRLGYLIQTSCSKQRGGCIQPSDMLRAATVNGAKALGRSRDLGSLAAGKAADLFMVDSRRLELAGALHDPASLPAKVGFGREVDLTMVNGKVVFQKGVLAGVDEAELAAQAERCVDAVLRQHCGVFAPYHHR